ncbi:Uncharacterized protein AXF42_Ash017967 [Apostasia shenzhenica]|uniref:Non-specific serine/threonine protein kinase n=1 Tax=Apostasia shenzhenica TaxID=1088818 RepID=A0A2I0A503_9ASPA|nr:Uncharacterized protein AXF42_Ash017967 [Apostasia shenzhenica]
MSELISLLLLLSAASLQPATPASPPATLPPSSFLNRNQYEAYQVIQRFKLTITCDPFNVTSSWSGPRPCSYRGFFCESPPFLSGVPVVASVDFNGFHLCAPTLSGFLDRLPTLAIFHANSNRFAGSVPDLSSLPFLYELDLSNNLLSGAFPAAVLPLTQLTFLDLRYNRFSGALPPAAFAISDVNVLFLNNNLFAQNLPADVGSTPAGFLTLANNAFTGPIPASISNASDSLVEVLFLNNRLSGCLPFEVGLLRRSTVEQLNLAGNQLYGTVPDVVCRLAQVGKLANFSLSSNYFTGIGKSCRGLIKSGLLDVRRNCIVGLPGQRSPAECAAFQARPKFCPPLTRIPCKLPARGLRDIEGSGDEDDGVTFPAEVERSPAADFRAYSALKRPGGNGF